MTNDQNQIESPFVGISPAAEGRMSVRQLISPMGTMMTVMKTHEPGIVFQVVADGYIFGLAVTDEAAILQRNEDILLAPLPTNDRNKYSIILIRWEPTCFGLCVVDSEGKREGEAKTVPVYPPSILRTWARKRALIPNIKYSSAEHLFDTIYELLGQLKDKILSTNGIDAFWDTAYKSKKITGRRPKREVEIHPTIRLLFDDYEITKNIQVIPEFRTGGGQLDFLVTGIIEDDSIVKICVEFKNAHSSDIEHGIRVQLPTYMESTGTDYGIYCVLDYGDEFPPNLSKFNHGEVKFGDATLEVHLAMAASLTNKKFLKTIILNVGHPEAPSKRRR